MIQGISRPTKNVLISRKIRALSPGFSLLELLVVVAIVGVLALFTLTGFRNLAASHGIRQAVGDVNGILELARNEAVTRQTYVWAAFRETVQHGTLELQMALAGSIDGTTNAAGTNLAALSRVLRARNVGLAKWSELSPETRMRLTNGTPQDLGSVAGIVYTNLSQAAFTNTTITFTPRGEAMLKGAPGPTDGFTHLIAVGIVPARGDVKQIGSKEDAAVILDGSTGLPRILTP